MEKIIIVAMDEENTIGKDGDIPWHYSEDMKYFKEKTTGHSVLMGRTTYESLPKDFRPLPDRENIVLTRSNLGLGESVKVANSLEEGFEMAENEKVFIAGGASIYRQTLDLADKMLITRIPGDHNGDTSFPEFNEENWKLESSTESGDLIFEEYTSKD